MTTSQYDELDAVRARSRVTAAILREQPDAARAAHPDAVGQGWDAIHTADTACIRAARLLRKERGLFAADGLYNYGRTTAEALALAERSVTTAESCAARFAAA